MAAKEMTPIIDGEYERIKLEGFGWIEDSNNARNSKD
jgi:hypothetical protein